MNRNSKRIVKYPSQDRAPRWRVRSGILSPDSIDHRSGSPIRVAVRKSWLASSNLYHPKDRLGRFRLPPGGFYKAAAVAKLGLGPPVAG